MFSILTGLCCVQVFISIICPALQAGRFRAFTVTLHHTLRNNRSLAFRVIPFEQLQVRVPPACALDRSREQRVGGSRWRREGEAFQVIKVSAPALLVSGAGGTLRVGS